MAKTFASHFNRLFEFHGNQSHGPMQSLSFSAEVTRKSNFRFQTNENVAPITKREGSLLTFSLPIMPFRPKKIAKLVPARAIPVVSKGQDTDSYGDEVANHHSFLSFYSFRSRSWFHLLVGLVRARRFRLPSKIIGKIHIAPLQSLELSRHIWPGLSAPFFLILYQRFSRLLFRVILNHR